MKIICDCTNLLGDSLYLLKPVKKLLSVNQDVVCVVAHPGLAYEMFLGVLPTDSVVLTDVNKAKELFPDAAVLSMQAGQAGEYSFRHSTEKDQPHISEAYAAILGVDLDGDVSPETSWQKIQEELPRTFIAISPFSRSCSRHTPPYIPNKTLDDNKWEYFIRYLRRQDYPVKVIAGPNDRLKVNSVPLDDYFTASSLVELERFLKSCALLVTVDNGLGHIASAIHTPMISLWPKVSNINFIYPRFSNHTLAVLMEPTHTALMMMPGVRQWARRLLA